MKITVDANIIFACLMKDSMTRRLLFNPGMSIFAPEFIIDEMLSHILEIKKKSGLRKDELSRLILKVFSQITCVPDKELRPFLPAAASLIKDPEDWLYLACALKEDTVIWSNDNDFAPQKRVRIITTKELINLVGSL